MADIIRAHEWLSLSYRAPRISRRVQIRVAASRPVDVWALPEEELASFSSSQDFEYYVRRTRMKLASFTFRPDGGRDWALIVDNLNPTAVSVRYDVIW